MIKDTNEPLRKQQIRYIPNKILMILSVGCAFIAFSTGAFIIANLIFDFIKTDWQKSYNIAGETYFLLLIVARVVLCVVALYPIHPAIATYRAHAAKKCIHAVVTITYVVLWCTCVIWTYSISDLVFIFFGIMSFVSAFMVYACSEPGFTSNYSFSWLT